MKADDVKASYRRLIYENGEQVTLRRPLPLELDYGLASERVAGTLVDYGLASEAVASIVDLGIEGDGFDTTLTARIIPTFSPTDLVAAVQQVGRKAVICADDVDASLFPLPFKAKSDRLMLDDGSVLTITAIDKTTRRVAGVLIAYELELSGA